MIIHLERPRNRCYIGDVLGSLEREAANRPCTCECQTDFKQPFRKHNGMQLGYVGAAFLRSVLTYRAITSDYANHHNINILSVGGRGDACIAFALLIPFTYKYLCNNGQCITITSYQNIKYAI